MSSFIPAEYCDTYTLRLVPLACSVINFLLIYEIKSLMLYTADKRAESDVLLETLSLITLPPLYFFAHVYYTDVPSITTLLFMILFSLTKCHKLSTIFGAASVLMRQTNIIWVAGSLGVHLVDKMMMKVYPKTKRENLTFANFMFALKAHFRRPQLLMEFIGGSIQDFYGYFLIILSFIAFVFFNGSIVVGDKTAHEASIHIPQLFYFSLFVLVFGASLWIPQLLKAHKIFGNWKYVVAIVFLASAITHAVQYNTLVHPYMLADNRHYTFYIWNRFYGRYDWARFAVIPVYVFGLVTIFNSLDGSIGFKIFFILSTVLTLCLQKMIEVRYFFIPFLLLRLNQTKVSKTWTFVELLVNLFIGYLTFSIFFTTEIKWKDFNDIQRIIW